MGSNGQSLTESSLERHESNNLKNLETAPVGDIDEQDFPLKVVPIQEESALMAELKKPQLMSKKVVINEVPIVKASEDMMDDDMEEDDFGMVIDEQDEGEEEEEESKTSQDADMADEIDHLNLQPVIVTDETRKESFLSSLGLVTKEALSELQNKKYTRKRRSTANPHFSNAAIEAKRINQMELAAKKARRKEQMAEMRCNKPARMSLYRRPEGHLKTLSPPDTNKEKHASSIITAKRQSLIEKMSKVSCNCFVCSESCDTQMDVCLFCDCKCLFHATCAASLDEIVNSGFVPCPKCDNKKCMEDELTSNEEMQMKVAKSLPKPPKITLAPPSIKVKAKERAEEVVKVRKPKKLKGERTSTTSNTSLLDGANRENGDPKEESRKLHYEDKRKELISLMEKKCKLEQEWKDRKTKLEKIKDTYKLIQERSTKLECNRKTVSGDIDTLIKFIKSVQMIDPDEGVQKQQYQLPQLLPAQPSMTITAVNNIPVPISNVSTINANGPPVLLNVPVVTVTANGTQVTTTNAAPTPMVDTNTGPPVISTTVSSVGNKVISINTSHRPPPIRAGPINVPQILPKVVTTSSVPVNSSNGTIEIMLQRVPEFTPCMPVRNVSPGWVTVPVSSLASVGGKLIVPRIITSSNVSGGFRAPDPSKIQADVNRTNANVCASEIRPADVTKKLADTSRIKTASSAAKLQVDASPPNNAPDTEIQPVDTSKIETEMVKTEPNISTNPGLRTSGSQKSNVELHRSKKMWQESSSPYIPIVRSALTQNNTKTYSGKLSTGKCSTPEPVVKIEPQVIEVAVNNNVVPEIIMDQSEVRVISDDLPFVTNPDIELPDVIMESVVQSEVDVSTSEVTPISTPTKDIPEPVSNIDLPEVLLDTTLKSDSEPSPASAPAIAPSVATGVVSSSEEKPVVVEQGVRRSPRQRESKSFPGFTKFERKGRAKT